jgi:ribonuclease-3
LGHVFQDLALFEQALRHRSASRNNNERLEFLGDSVLNLVISRYLYDHFPNHSEGEWTRLRARLVCEASLATVAERFQLGAYLILGGGEQRSGAAYRASILADALEALIGALYLELGLLGCENLILNWFQPELTQLAGLSQAPKDAKTRLQEALQAKRLPLPGYTLVESKGSAHEPWFRMSCELPELGINTWGEANSHRKAEQAAAESALGELETFLKKKKSEIKRDRDR